MKLPQQILSGKGIIMNIQEKDIAFCSSAFGKQYVPMLDRLIESINKIHPNAKQFIYRDRLPKNSKPHYGNDGSMYGFKIHAIQEALDAGYKKIVWLDSASILVNDIRRVFQYCKTHGIVASNDASFIWTNCNDSALKHFGITREEAKEKGLKFAAGSFYALDFDEPLCRQVFETWKESERLGLFGKSTDRWEDSGGPSGHRHDETCFGLSLWKHNLEYCTGQESGYCCCEYLPPGIPACPELIVTKKHFK